MVKVKVYKFLELVNLGQSRRNGGVLYPRTPGDTRAEPQRESRDIFLEGVQLEVDLQGGGSHTNACKRWVSLESSVGGQKMS